MAEEPGEQSQSLFRPPMSDPELDLEHQRGARPKVAGPLTTQTIQEEAKAASTEERALQLRGTDFYLPLVGQPRISERKSWRALIVTEQGNPGIYAQIDEWLPLYKGNIYVVDEVTGRMYLAKGEHLMRIAETVSHRPFRDHELSMSRHVPEREHPSQGGQEPPSGTEPEIAGEGRGDMDPLTPMTGAVGGIGRTPIPVAESMHHPGERPLTPVGKPKRERPDQRGEFPTPAPDQGGNTEEAQGDHQGGESQWALPEPSDPHRPPRGEMGKEEVSLQDTQGQDEGPSGQEYPTLNRQLIEADMKHRRRLATLARDHIMKLREEQERMAYDWLEEYAMRASSAKQSGVSLRALRAEYIHRYNRLLDREKQPHSDFFIHLSMDLEEELDFNEEEPFDLSEYDQYFEWDETEYMRL